MPANSKVGRCEKKVRAKGKSKVFAIRTCQATTGQSIRTGRKAKKKRRS